MRGGRRSIVLVVAAMGLVASLSTGTPASHASSPPPDRPELGPLISGTSSYVAGTYVWTDYAYDDRGPNTNNISGGDATYPANPYPGNTADIIEVQLGEEGGTLRAGVVLETLVNSGDALIGLGFNTDSNDLTGAANVPGGQWQVSRPLGIEHLALLSTATAQGTLLDAAPDGTFVPSGTFPVDVDRDRNLVSAVINGLQPGTATWQVLGIAGMEDASGSWFTGNHPIYDLAFVRAEDPPTDPIVTVTYSVPQIRSAWQDEVQSDVLVGKQSATEAAASVTFGTSRNEAPVVGPGVYTFLYHSQVDLGEGVRQSPLQFAGPYQPYAVVIPAGLPEHPPAIMFLHGANQNHMPNVVHFIPHGAVITGFYDVPAVVLLPLGRDPSWGTGPATMDMLETRADAIARLHLDTERMVLSGISAGGAGTFLLASRYPDLWTGAYSIVGSGTSRLENLTNVPFRAHNGLADPLVNVSSWLSSADALDAAATVDYRTVLVHTSSHLPAPEGNCWYLDLLSRPREINPARVRYSVPPAQVVDAATTLAPNGAYWVSDLQARGSDPAAIDATSFARHARIPAGDMDTVGENATHSEDFCGLRPGMQRGSNWHQLGRAFRPDTITLTNSMDVTLTGLSAAELDVARMAITTANPVTVHLAGDGPAALNLRGPWTGNVIVDRDGVTVFSGPVVDNVVVLSGDLSGLHTYTITPV